jgi:hypothetical protein
MRVNGVIFRDNGRDICLDPDGKKIENKFILENCVFSGTFRPQTNWYDLGSVSHKLTNRISQQNSQSNDQPHAQSNR